MQWPEFATRNELDDGWLAWTATFDSHHESRHVCVYKIVLLERDSILGEVAAEIDTRFTRDRAGAKFRDGLRARIAKIATLEASLASLRSKHPEPAAALAATDRRDLMLRIAFDAVPDRRKVVWFGARRIDKRSTMARLFVPWPERREALEAWTNDGQFDLEERAVVAWVFGAITGTPFAMALLHYVIEPHIPAGLERLFALLIPWFLIVATIATVRRAVTAAINGRRLERLDEHTALAQTLELLAQNEPQPDVLAEYSVKALRGHLLQMVADALADAPPTSA